MSAPAPSKPCLPCADCPLTQTPAACASPGTQRGFCLEATCGINLSFSATATRNPLTLKIKRELCNLTLKGPCLFKKDSLLFFFFLPPPKEQNESSGCPFPSQTHCFSASRMQESPWSLQGSLVGTICKGLPLNTVLLQFAQRTSISSRSHCSALWALTDNSQWGCQTPKFYYVHPLTAEDKGHMKSPMETTSHGKPRVLCATAEQPKGVASGEGLGSGVWFIMAGSFKGSCLGEALISLKY